MSKVFREGNRDAMRRHCPLPVFFGFDDVMEMRRLRKVGEPFVFMDHAYFHRGYRTDAYFRCIYNGVHRTNVLDVPGDRLEFFKVKRYDWKKSNDHIVFIPAPKNIETLYGAWNERALATIAKATDRKIRIKAKTDGNLGDFLNKCHGLVTHSSVAGVEAACLGFPVFGPETSPAFPVSNSLENIETPLHPDREPWLRTLAYSQFTTAEINDGRAWGILKELERL